MLELNTISRRAVQWRYIVIGGIDPWAEDFWKTIRIGGIAIDLMKPCDRCVVTTKDQKTGEPLGKEPLKILATMRKSADPRINGVLFGWNSAPRHGCRGGLH